MLYYNAGNDVCTVDFIYSSLHFPLVFICPVPFWLLSARLTVPWIPFIIGLTYEFSGRYRFMKQCMDSDNLHRRLKKIIGQVQAIDRMIDEDIPCEDILSQINAAKSALHKAGQVILEGHIQHCVRDGIQHGDADKTIESFTKAMERFANMK